MKGNLYKCMYTQRIYLVEGKDNGYIHILCTEFPYSRRIEQQETLDSGAYRRIA